MIKILGTGLPVIGYAKFGIASEKSSRLKGAPMKFDHIELTGRERDKDGRLIPDMDLMRDLIEHPAITTCGGCARSKALGFPEGLPTRLPIRLPYNSLDLNFPNRLALYRGGTAFCTGDGERAERLTVLQEGNGQRPEFGPPEPFGPCGAECPDFQSRRCKPNARLQFVLETQQNVGGCYQYKTTSWNSIRNIVGSLEAISGMTGGMLNWIPLFFEMSPQTVQPKGGGRANIAYIARVTHPGSPQQLLEAVKAALEVRAPLIGEIRKLEASIESRAGVWEEGGIEGEDYQEEFYPEGGDEEDDPPARDETLIDDEDVARLIEISQTRAKALNAGLSGDELLQLFLDEMGRPVTAEIPKADLPELLMELTRYTPSDPFDAPGTQKWGEEEPPPPDDDERDFGPGPGLFEGGS
jgi:hypothetical protein